MEVGILWLSQVGNIIQTTRMNFVFFIPVQLLRPIYKQIAENRNAELFSATTLLVILGTSLLTARVSEVFAIVIYLIYLYILQ